MLTPSPTLEQPARRDSMLLLGALVFFQMLPATLLVPTARPLFAQIYHTGDSYIHAFMSINMLGGFIAAPFIGWATDRLGFRLPTFVALGFLDALIQFLLPTGLPLPLLLALRTLQGATHVGAATLLLTCAASTARRTGNAKVMGIAGSALMLAVAFGSSIGGLLLKAGLSVPFWTGSGLAVLAAGLGFLLPQQWWTESRRSGVTFALLRNEPSLWVPVSSAFVGRFTVGCIVVSFALYAHRAFNITDTQVGLLYSLLTLPFALLMYPAARLGDRFPRVHVLVGGGAVYAFSLGLLGQVGPLALPGIMVLIGTSGALVFASTLCLAAGNVSPERRGTSMALVNSAGCLGMLLGPAVAGGLSVALKAQGWDSVEAYRAIFAVAALSSLLWLVSVAVWAKRQPTRREIFAFDR
ncbi:MAG: MFS transporter [Polyangiaceae bacterium]|nr:MFS transporter [Polyangiaceae bacterium]